MKGSAFASAVVSAFLVLGLVMPAYALKDADYLKFKKESPEFAEADRQLQAVWKEVRSLVDGDEKTALMEEQKRWIKAGRDEVAKRALDADKSLTPVKAYTNATAERASELKLYYERLKTPSKAGASSAQETASKPVVPAAQDTPAKQVASSVQQTASKPVVSAPQEAPSKVEVSAASENKSPVTFEDGNFGLAGFVAGEILDIPDVTKSTLGVSIKGKKARLEVRPVSENIEDSGHVLNNLSYLKNIDLLRYLTGKNEFAAPRLLEDLYSRREIKEIHPFLRYILAITDATVTTYDKQVMFIVQHKTYETDDEFDQALDAVFATIKQEGIDHTAEKRSVWAVANNSSISIDWNDHKRQMLFVVISKDNKKINENIQRIKKDIEARTATEPQAPLTQDEMMTEFGSLISMCGSGNAAMCDQLVDLVKTSLKGQQQAEMLRSLCSEMGIRSACQ